MKKGRAGGRGDRVPVKAVVFGGLAALVFLALLAASCVSAPLQYAAATGTVLAANEENYRARIGSEATRAAVTEAAQFAPTVRALEVAGTVSSIQAQQTRVSVSVMGTVSITQATVAAAGQQATATAAVMAHVAETAGTQARTEQANRLLGSLSAACALILLSMLAYWGAMIARRRSLRIGQTPTGVVFVNDRGETVNSSTMVESVQTPSTRQDDWLWQIGRAVRYLRTGKVAALPEARLPLLNDAGVSGEARAKVAAVARAGDALAAAMSSEISEPERLERMKALRGQGARGGTAAESQWALVTDLLKGRGDAAMPPAPPVNLLPGGQGAEEAQYVARRLGLDADVLDAVKVEKQ